MKGHAKMAPGDVLAGRYRLEALIGEGGFGAVYRATQLPIGRGVALKVLLDGMLAQSDGRARFRREAELAQRLEHPNTVRLYDFGETDEGVQFIAWELLKGRPLDAVLGAEGPLAAARAAKIAVQILKALMEAHALGIVHRDLKPANVFLCQFPGESDFVKVLDFGLAKTTLTRGATRMTPEGFILGTPAYMSPEQAKGAEVGPASDLFSLGLMMAELITGARVFPGSSPWDVITAQIADRPTPLAPEVLASPLGPVIARATERSLDRRYGSAAEMLRDLETFVPEGSSPRIVADLRPPPALPTAIAPAAPSAQAAPAPAIRRSRGRIFLVAAGGVCVAAVMVLGGLYAAGVFDRPGRASSGVAAPGTATGRPFAGLDNKQIRARIEAARYKILLTDDKDPATTWMLADINGGYVQVIRLRDLKTAVAMEQSLLKQPGATARDGSHVLHVHIPQAAPARELLAQIIR